MKKAFQYMTRNWSEYERPPHPLIELIPPFFIEVMAYLLGLSLVYHAGEYLLSLF